MTNKSKNSACTLDSKELQEYWKRTKVALQSNLHKLRQYENKTDHLLLRFTYDQSLEQCLQALIAKEEQCCPCLNFDMKTDDKSIVLSIKHVDGSAALNKMLQNLLGECCGDEAIKKESCSISQRSFKAKNRLLILPAIALLACTAPFIATLFGVSGLLVILEPHRTWLTYIEIMGFTLLIGFTGLIFYKKAIAKKPSINTLSKKQCEAKYEKNCCANENRGCC